MDTYYITEEHLGDEATEKQATAMVEFLQECGYDIEYGAAINRHDPIDDDDWYAGLDYVSNMDD